MPAPPFSPGNEATLPNRRWRLILIPCKAHYGRTITAAGKQQQAAMPRKVAVAGVIKESMSAKLARIALVFFSAQCIIDPAFRSFKRHI